MRFSFNYLEKVVIKSNKLNNLIILINNSIFLCIHKKIKEQKEYKTNIYLLNRFQF
jgi:hypothetical protein